MDRNKFLSLIAATTFVFAGCTSEDITEVTVPQNHNEVLSFGVVDYKDFRGLEMTDGQLRSTGFGVTAYYTEQKTWQEQPIMPNYMYNQNVVNKDDKWVYSPLKYWPSRPDDKLTFFAYAPYENQNEKKYGIELSGNTEVGTPYVKFTTKDSPADMVDFVTSVLIDKTKSPVKDALNSIDFKFKHELVRFEFAAKNNTPGSYLNVKNVWLTFTPQSNVYKTATYKFPTDNEQKGTWDFAEGVKFAGDYFLKGILDVSQDVNIAGKGENKYEVDGILINAQQVAKLFDGKYLFFIPAEGENGLNEGAVVVTFEYDLVTMDDNLAIGFSTTSHTKSIVLPPGRFKQGLSYPVTFLLNADSIDIETTI